MGINQSRLKKLEKLKRVGYGMLAAGLISSVVFYSALIHSAVKADNLEENIDTNYASVYAKCLDNKELDLSKDLYNNYKSGKIDAKEFNKQLHNLYSEKHLKDLYQDNVTQEMQEENESLQKEVDKYSEITCMMAIPAVISSVAALIGGPIIGEPTSEKIKKIQEQEM